MAKKTDDEKVLALMQEVTKRKKEISQCERPNWRTSCTMTPNKAESAPVNLHVEKNIGSLVGIAAFLMEKERSYNEAAAKLGAEDVPAFAWGGFSVADWLEDIKLRVSQVQIDKKKKKLEVTEARLNAVISPELRRQMELEAIEKELG